MLLVFTYRPGYAHPFGERSYFTRVVPAALSAPTTARAWPPPSSRRRAARRAAAPSSAPRPRATRSSSRRSCKSLQESGRAPRESDGRLVLARPLEDVAIPDTIHDVIAARIDRLAEAPKRTLQLASVIGREFTRRLLDRLAEIRERTRRAPAGAHGARADLRAARSIPSWRTCSSTRSRRTSPTTRCSSSAAGSCMRLVGRAIEELYADRLAEHYEMLAHHFSKAEDWPRALDYLLKAAREGHPGLRPAPGAGALRRGPDVGGAAGGAGARGHPHGHPSGASGPLLRARRVRPLARGGRDGSSASRGASRIVPRRRARSCRSPPRSSGSRTSRRRTSACGRPSRSRRRWGREGPLAGGLYIRGYLNAVNGRLDLAEATSAGPWRSDGPRAMPIARRSSCTCCALQRSWQGQYRESLALGEEGVRLAREHRLVIPLLRWLWNQGLACHEMGEYDRALAALVEGLALAEKVGDDALIPRFLNTLGFLRIDCGDFDAGIALSERAYEETGRSSRAGHGTGAERRAFIRNNEADAFMARGRPRERRPGPGRVAPHRPASAAVALDDVALRHALLREPGPAGPPARATPTPRGASPSRAWSWRLRRAREVRGLGVAAQGRERHRAACLVRGGGGIASRGGPRGRRRPAAPNVAEPSPAWGASSRPAGVGRTRGRRMARPGTSSRRSAGGPGTPTSAGASSRFALAREVESSLRR